VLLVIVLGVGGLVGLGLSKGWFETRRARSRQALQVADLRVWIISAE
jgi:hypothetical protein